MNSLMNAMKRLVSWTTTLSMWSLFTMRKKYYPNNWKVIHDTPAEAFEFPDGGLTFEEFMDWKIGGYEIKDDYCCVIRAKDMDNGKIKEYAYQLRHAARKKYRKLKDKGKYELTIVQRDTVHFIQPYDYGII